MFPRELHIVYECNCGTVGYHKTKATKAFKETYLIYQNFEADQLLDCKVANETTQVNNCSDLERMHSSTEGTIVVKED